MIENILFSVIMPCYNSEEYVLNAIESVQNQTYANWELIAINDGSIDGTLDILNDKSKQDNRIKVFSKENGGYSSAVNFGLSKISGTYFLFLGSDDRLDENLFSELIISCKLQEKQPDMIGFKSLRVNSDEEDIASKFDRYEEKYNTTIAEYAELYPDHSIIMGARDTAKCFKTDLLEDTRYFGKYGVGADDIFAIMMAHKAKSFASVPFFGYLWTIRQGSVSGHISEEKNIDRFNNMYMFYTVFPKNMLFQNSYWEKEHLRKSYEEFKNYCIWLRWIPLFKKYFYIRKNLKIIKKVNKIINCEIKDIFLYFPLFYIIKDRLRKKVLRK